MKNLQILFFSSSLRLSALSGFLIVYYIYPLNNDCFGFRGSRISRNPQISLLRVLIVPLALSASAFTLYMSKLCANLICLFGVNIY